MENPRPNEDYLNDSDLFLERARKVDTNNIKEDFDMWPQLAEKAWNDTDVPEIGTHINRIALVGMGGSGLIGEVVRDILIESGSNVLVQVIRDYELPGYVNKNTLIIGVSASGNTEETISALQQATGKGLHGYAFSSGGKIEEIAKKDPNFIFVKTPMLKTPRSSLPGMVYPVLRFLKSNSIFDITDQEIEDSMKVISDVQKSSGSMSLKENSAFNIATRIFDGKKLNIPLVYASRRTRAAGMRFRQSLNENAKVHAFNGEIPELCHNDVVGWDADSEQKYVPFMLRLQDDPKTINMRFEILKDLIHGRKVETIEAPYTGKYYTSRMLSMLYHLDYVTYYTAILRGVDPSITTFIDEMKSKLTKYK